MKSEDGRLHRLVFLRNPVTEEVLGYLPPWAPVILFFSFRKYLVTPGDLTCQTQFKVKRSKNFDKEMQVGKETVLAIADVETSALRFL